MTDPEALQGNLGSTFDSFLEAEGIKEEVEQLADQRGKEKERERASMVLTTREQKIFTTLEVLLQLGHIDSARLILAEVLGQRLEDPGLDPLTLLDDDAFEALSERVREEASRRNRVFHPRPGDLICKFASRLVPGDIVSFPRPDGPTTESSYVEREVLSVRDDGGWLHLEFADGVQICRQRPNQMMTVKKR